MYRWRSDRAGRVHTLSTAEAEYISLEKGYKEVIGWVELDYTQKSPIIYDNQDKQELNFVKKMALERYFLTILIMMEIEKGTTQKLLVKFQKK